MEAIKLENNMLRLPERIAKRLRGKKIVVAEVQEGILLKASGHPISEARGFLKKMGGNFSRNLSIGKNQTLNRYRHFYRLP